MSFGERVFVVFAALLLLTFISVIVAINLVPQPPDYKYGQMVRIKRGFYEGCEGPLVKKNEHIYHINAVCSEPVLFFLPLTVEIVATADAFELIKEPAQ